MTPDERERLNQLCSRIQTEKDQAKFSQLLTELNELLEKKEQRFIQEAKKDPLLRPPQPNP